MAIEPWSSDLDPTPAHRRTPPFNTGRVRIGSRYEPPLRWEPSRDAYDLQSALLAAAGRTAPPVSLLQRLKDFLVGRDW